MARATSPALDVELSDLPPPARWRTWMASAEAVLFAAAGPVERATLARIVGADCNLDQLVDDIRAELAGRPYEIVAVAGGWQFRTRPAFAPVIRAALFPAARQGPALSDTESLVLTAIAYLQPVTRAELADVLGRTVSRDQIAALGSDGFIAPGPRSPLPGRPYTYVTTPAFLAAFGLKSLRDLPDRDALEEAGLLTRVPAPREGITPFGGPASDEDAEEDALPPLL